MIGRRDAIRAGSLGGYGNIKTQAGYPKPDDPESTPMKVQGACHCGQISFEAEIDPEAVRICHCADCQQMSGSAYRVNVAAPAETFVLRSGAPKTYLRTADSGNERAHAFCANCGTQIYAAAPRDPPTYSIRVGTLKQRAELVPKRQIWYRSALTWAADLRSIPQVERQSS